MKIASTLAAAAMLGLGVMQAPSATAVLFVGNSFTYGAGSPVMFYRAGTVTDLNAEGIGGVPALFKSFTTQAGLDYDVSLETRGGSGLEFHLANKRDVLGTRAWDAVVMHGQSTLDFEKPGDPAKLVATSRQMAELFRARNPKVQLYLMATWSRADQVYKGPGPWFGKPIETMARDVRAAYDQAAATAPGVKAVIPVGEAWMRAMATGLADPNPYDGVDAGKVDLWTYDHYHASTHGYYLEALVVFGSLTGRDPRSLGDAECSAFELGLPRAEVRALQQIAFDQLGSAVTPAPAGPSAAATPRRCVSPDRPVAAGASPALPALVLAGPVNHLGVAAREPMVVEHPDGTLFVSGYGSEAPALWKSRDRGATWARVDVGTEASGAIGNSDVDLAVAPNGTLYYATMVFDRKKLEGTSISIGVSTDAGTTWSWTLLSKTRFDDRPWVEVAADGRAHVIWNDGSGVCHAASEDGGRTWTERPRIHAQGGSSHLALGANRDMAVRVTPLSASGNRFDEGVDLVAVSGDGGTTWQKHTAPGRREWSPMVDTTVTPPRWLEPAQPRWVEPLAWDAQGALYSLWTNREGLWLARSADRGATWTNWRVAENRDVLFYPYLIARGRGELAATWFSGRGDTLQAHAARIEIGEGTAAPRVVQSQPFQIDSWAAGAPPATPPSRDTAGEYLAMTFLRDGSLGMVSPIQNRAAQRAGFSWWRIEIR